MKYLLTIAAVECYLASLLVSPFAAEPQSSGYADASADHGCLQEGQYRQSGGCG